MKIIISDELERTMKRLKRKDRKTFEALVKKIIQISSLDRQTAQYFKNLRGEMREYKRAHLGSFVLLFKVEDDTIVFDRFVHHDKAYQ